jgi:phosphatidate cytidylyltransferase
MARVLSALVLLPILIGTVWFLPPIGTLVLALVAATRAFVEYAAIAAALGARMPRAISGAAVLGACAALGSGWTLVAVMLLTAMIALGALAAVREIGGREAVLLITATIVISDSAQYYSGRALGRRPLAPAISPKKTREGAIGGVVFGTVAFAIGARYVFPAAPILLVALVGASIATLGIVGDLFESLLKRSAGVKDSGTLIPGHGGVLDRIDSWLFAAPVYYVFVRYFRF